VSLIIWLVGAVAGGFAVGDLFGGFVQKAGSEPDRDDPAALLAIIEPDSGKYQ
jgi:hypothetical protein